MFKVYIQIKNKQILYKTFFIFQLSILNILASNFCYFCFFDRKIFISLSFATPYKIVNADK